MTHQFDEFAFHPTSGWIVCRENAARFTQAALGYSRLKIGIHYSWYRINNLLY
jgi:hypothetical protein